MQVTLIAMISADGKLTRGEESNIQEWRSTADRTVLRHLLWHHEAVVMGRKGYEAHKVQPRTGRFYIVMTKSPEAFKDEVVPEQREFWSDDPDKLLQKLEDRGIERVAIVTGGALNGAFLKTGQVCDVYLTIEPRLFGQGLALTGQEPLDVKLKLEQVTQLNEQGTLLVHYSCPSA